MYTSSTPAKILEIRIWFESDRFLLEMGFSMRPLIDFQFKHAHGSDSFHARWCHSRTFCGDQI